MSSPQANAPSFGERIATVDQLLSGKISRESIREWFAIDDGELDRWVRIHARDRLFSIDEFRLPKASEPRLRRLLSRLRVLETLLRERRRELSLLRSLARSRSLL